MLTEGTRYMVELACGYPGWWRFNLYVTVVCFDGGGNSISFRNFSDKVYDPQISSERISPEGFDPARRAVHVESAPCSYIEVYVYAVTNTFPDSDSIKNSPPFDAVLTVSAAGKVVGSEVYRVNQWGGLTVAGRKFGPVG